MTCKGWVVITQSGEPFAGGKQIVLYQVKRDAAWGLRPGTGVHAATLIVEDAPKWTKRRAKRVTETDMIDAVYGRAKK